MHQEKSCIYLKRSERKQLPMHETKSEANAYPDLQVHLKEPCVLVHMCWQPPFLFEHSFVSETNCNKYLNV